MLAKLTELIKKLNQLKEILIKINKKKLKEKIKKKSKKKLSKKRINR